MPTFQRHNRSLLMGLALLALAVALGALMSTRAGGRSPSLGAAALLQSQAAQRPINKTDGLIWDYQERLRQSPDDVYAYAVLGSAFVQKARETGDPSFYGRAEEAFDAALERDSMHVDALVGKGALALARHQFADALALGEQARAINPDVPRIYGLIGDAQIELGMYDEAVATIQTMVDKRPDLGSYSRVAYLRELHGDVAGAIEAMELALSAGGPNQENTEWTRVQLGHLYFNKGDLGQAERYYREALLRLPDYVYAEAGLARVRAAQGRSAEALMLYRGAVERMPLPEFVIAYGELLEATGRGTEAQEQYALVEGIQQLFAASGVNSDLELALFAADQGSDPQATVAQARAAYGERPGIKGADALAWALFRAGQLDEARRYAEEALRLGTQDALLFYHAGAIAHAQGDIAAARTYLGQALAINPHFSPLQAPHAEALLGEVGG